MVSTLLMLQRLRKVLRHAVQQEGFLPVFSAGLLLTLLGTLAYAIGEGWGVIDSLYFAFSKLTTTGISDPQLVLTSDWLKLFTILYQLVGIGIIIGIVQRLGVSFLSVRSVDRQTRIDKRQPPPDAAGAEPQPTD